MKSVACNDAHQEGDDIEIAGHERPVEHVEDREGDDGRQDQQEDDPVPAEEGHDASKPRAP